MRRVALLLVIFTGFVSAWQVGGTIGLDMFPVSQMLFRGLDVDQAVGMDYEGPKHGYTARVMASHPWREFIVSISLERINHGENSIYWTGLETVPGLEMVYSGTGGFPAYSLSLSLSYPFAQYQDWEFHFENGLSLLSSEVWLERQTYMRTSGVEMIINTYGEASGIGIGGNAGLVLKRTFEPFIFLLHGGYSLAHIRASGKAYEEEEGSEKEPEYRDITMDVNYDGPYLKLSLLYQL